MTRPRFKLRKSGPRIHVFRTDPCASIKDKRMPPPKEVKVAAAAAKSLQSYPTLCDPIDGSPPGSAVPGILQARTLEWVAISFSSA